MSHEHPQDSVSPYVAPGVGAPLCEDLAQACAALAADPHRREVAIIDVDEVIALFVQGFDGYLRRYGHELRLTHFSLLGCLYAQAGQEPVDKDTGRKLLTAFFTHGCGELEATPDAAAVLARLSRRAQVVILTAAPIVARTHRAAWLRAQGFDYPLVVSGGDKGPEVAALAKAAGGRAVFVDDILRNLDSAQVHAPRVARFQLVADPALRPLAPAAPERHRRVEDWLELEPLLEQALWGPPT